MKTNIISLSFFTVIASALGTNMLCAQNTFPSSGYVGIGTTSPGQTIDIVDSSYLQARLRSSASGFAGGIELWGYDGSAYQQFELQSLPSNATPGSAFIIYDRTHSLYDVTINSSGNFGIGTTNPTGRLTVESSAAGPLSISNDNNTYLALGQWKTSGGHDYRIGIDSDYLWFAGHKGFRWYQTDTGAVDMVIASGNVGIGTTNPTQKLSVAGTIQAYEVIVDASWSDYVFEKNYRLTPLNEVEQYIATEHHLPGMPSAKEVSDHGVSLGTIESKLLAKIEELTLHQIEQEKRIDALEQENAALRRSGNGSSR